MIISILECLPITDSLLNISGLFHIIQFFKMFSQVLAMFLFTVLDYKESYSDKSPEFSLLIDDPLKVAACARYIVETSYGMLMLLSEDDPPQ